MATKFEVTITEVTTRSFGFEGRSRGTVVRLAGHWTIEGLEVARFGEVYREICGNCQGGGFIAHYQHIDSGICFACMGAGFRGTFGTGSAIELARKLRNRAQAAERREAKRAAKFAAMDAQRVIDLNAWLAANAELAAAAAPFSTYMICDHDNRRMYGECWKCDERVDEATKTIDRELLVLAYETTWKALTEHETAKLVRLLAQHEVRVAKLAAYAERTAAKVWVGEQGQKITVTGTLAEPKHFESKFGDSTLYKITTAEGNTVTWFRSGWHNPEAGTTITLTGTVKELKDSEKYGKETQLTRCKIS